MARTDHVVEPEELMAYLDGELSPDRGATAAAHLEHCRECQAIAADVQSVSRQMMAWQVETSEFPSTATITSALEQQARDKSCQVTGRSLYTMQRLRPWILAACLAVLLGLVMPSFRQQGTSVDRVRTSQPVSAIHAIGMAEIASANGSLPSTKPMIARTAQLSLTTTGFDRVRDRISEVLKRHQGYIGELNVSSPAGAARTLEATLRVPADQLEAAITELKGLGRVESESQSGEEVTQQYVDLEARLTNARNTEQRLTDLLRQRTGKLSDVLEVEQEVDRVRGEIEQMEAERKTMSNQVSFATLNATITEEYKAQLQVVPPSTSTRLSNAAVEGYKSMMDGVVSLALFLLENGPTLLFWGAVLFFPARLVWKRVRRSFAQ